MVIIGVLTAISLPFLIGAKRLYKSEDQALKIMDLMREANQLAMTRRRTMRFEIDAVTNQIFIIDETGPNALITTDDSRVVKAIPLEAGSELRFDQNPTGVTQPSPPNYTNASFTTYPSGYTRGGQSVTSTKVFIARFRSDGSAVNSTGNLVNATLYVWNPNPANTNQARDLKLVRAITLFGGSAAVRYWKYDGIAFKAF